MRLTIIGGDKGGIGKDLVASAVVCAAMERGDNVQVHEVEMDRRLGEFYPDSKFHPVSAKSVEEILETQGHAAIEGFQSFAAEIEELDDATTHIAVLGASLTSGLLTYLGNGEDSLAAELFGDGDGIAFGIVATMQETALETAVTNLRDIHRAMPKAKRVFVMNDVLADFPDPETDDYIGGYLRIAADGGKLSTVRVSRCNSPAWGLVMSAAPLHTLADKEKVKAFLKDKRKQKASAPSMVPGVKMLREWIAKTTDAVATLLPPSAKPKAAKKSAAE